MRTRFRRRECSRHTFAPVIALEFEASQLGKE
jgi:hypothetical protein